MKKISLLISMLLIAGFTFAQEGEAPLHKGQKQLNFGLGSGYYGLPVYGGVDFAVSNDVTIGPVLQMRFGYGYVDFGGFFRGDYHFNRIIGIPSNFDFYAGGSLGFFTGSNGLYLSAQVGGRWYWDEKWGLNVELGGGTGYGGAIGLSMKF